MRRRLVGLFAIGFALETAVDGLAQARCTNQNPTFSGVDLRIEQRIGDLNGDSRLSVLSLPSSNGAYSAVTYGIVYLAGENSVEPTTTPRNDALWIAFEPAVETWTKRARGFRVGVGGGPAFNFIRTIGSDWSDTVFKMGAVGRVTLRHELRAGLVSRSDTTHRYSSVVLFSRLEPSDFVPGATGDELRRFVHGPYFGLRF